MNLTYMKKRYMPSKPKKTYQTREIRQLVLIAWKKKEMYQQNLWLWDLKRRWVLINVINTHAKRTIILTLKDMMKMQSNAFVLIKFLTLHSILAVCASTDFDLFYLLQQVIFSISFSFTIIKMRPTWLPYMIIWFKRFFIVARIIL